MATEKYCSQLQWSCNLKMCQRRAVNSLFLQKQPKNNGEASQKPNGFKKNKS